ncbi:hypothetical protein [Streptomyces sp. MMS24-I29]|uniref:hypothetical protein n=1 Tax=Streptomyces sp. MMS24-I29 TaxID=3351480 RepID=UPI003C7C2E24
MNKKLGSGLEVRALGKCFDSWFDNAATMAVTLKPSPNFSRTHETYGKCQKHIDRQYLSAEDYAKRIAGYTGTYRPHVFDRSLYEIRPLTIQEAAEVAYEQAAPKRWEAEDRIGDFRRIVELHQCEAIDGVLVDATSAQLVVLVYDKLKPENQEKFRRLSVHQQCEIALKLAG